MSELESIGKLRKLFARILMSDDPHYRLPDEIQAEVDERYMPLPVDADGVPIHVGDVLENGEYKGAVTDMSWDGRFWHIYHGSIAIAPCDYTHVKPHTLEDVIYDIAINSVQLERYENGIPVVGVNKDQLRDEIETHVDEIRELMRGDA